MDSGNKFFKIFVIIEQHNFNFVALNIYREKIWETSLILAGYCSFATHKNEKHSINLYDTLATFTITEKIQTLVRSYDRSSEDFKRVLEVYPAYALCSNCFANFFGWSFNLLNCCVYFSVLESSCRIWIGSLPNKVSTNWEALPRMLFQHFPWVSSRKSWIM